MASTMASVESTLSRLGADVMMLKEGAGKREKRITELVNYNEDDVAERTYTKHGPGSMDHPMDLVHGPSPWTTRRKCENALDLLHLKASF